MNTIRSLLERTPFEMFRGDGATGVDNISADSREVGPGTLFFALRGGRFDGRRCLRAVEHAGACGAVLEDGTELEDFVCDSTLPVAVVSNVRQALAVAARHLLAPDFAKLKSVGVTGTNGKSSTTWLVAQALSRLSERALYAGTLGMRLFADGAQEWDHPLSLTTPEAIEFFSGVRSAPQPTAVVAEVSSIALTQRRISGTPWDVCVFTNLTRDHLDYHGSLREYGEAKSSLFLEELRMSSKQRRTACLNCDDPWGLELFERCSQVKELSVVGYSLRDSSTAAVRLRGAEKSLAGTSLTVECGGHVVDIASRLIGDYNVENLVAALSALTALGVAAADGAAALSDCDPVPGRLERVTGGESAAIFVDYAHTPDALSRAQSSLRELCGGRLITVFGCGGDRDRGKRPQMGREVAAVSDIAIVTSDNPRSEDPERIIADILPGVEGAGRGAGFAFEVEPDRRRAIERAVDLARPGDAVLIAGKGHEDYQEIAGVKYPFSDREVVGEVLGICQQKRSGAH